MKKIIILFGFAALLTACAVNPLPASTHALVVPEIPALKQLVEQRSYVDKTLDDPNIYYKEAPVSNPIHVYCVTFLTYYCFK